MACDQHIVIWFSVWMGLTYFVVIKNATERAFKKMHFSSKINQTENVLMVGLIDIYE